jgi:hypothetical protein
VHINWLISIGFLGISVKNGTLNLFLTYTWSFCKPIKNIGICI